MEKAAKDLLILITKEEIEMLLSVSSFANNSLAFDRLCNEFVAKMDSDDFKNRFAMLKENEAAFQVLKKLHLKHIHHFGNFVS